jgi:hypothetical protein
MTPDKAAQGVVRYDCCDNTAGGYYDPHKDPEGEWVAYEDYATLQQRLGEMEEDLARVRGHANVLAMDLGRTKEQLATTVAERGGLREALRNIADKEQESDEWDAVTKYGECQGIARAALSPSAASSKSVAKRVAAQKGEPYPYPAPATADNDQPSGRKP